MQNLDPIEEKDLDLEHKFAEKSPSEPGMEKTEVPEAEKATAERNGEKNERLKENYDKLLNQVKEQSLPAVEADIIPDADNLTKIENVEKQINGLIELSKNKGVTHAVRVAIKLLDNYALDEFHDRICADEELVKRLIKEGSIKNL